MTENRAGAHLLAHLPPGAVLDRLALEHGRSVIVTQPDVITRLSTATLTALSRGASAADAVTLAESSTNPDYLAFVWQDDRRVTVSRAVAGNSHISPDLRRAIVRSTSDTQTVNEVLRATPDDDLWPLIMDCPHMLGSLAHNVSGAASRAARHLREHPVETWVELTSVTARGDEILAGAIAHNPLKESDLFTIINQVKDLPLASDSHVRRAIAAELETLAPARVFPAWQELGWSELLRAALRTNPADVPLDVVASEYGLPTVVDSYRQAELPVDDSLVDLILEAPAYTFSQLKALPLSDEQVERIASHESPQQDGAARMRRETWLYANATPTQRVYLLSRLDELRARQPRMRLSTFAELVDAGLEVERIEMWSLVGVNSPYEWDNYPHIRELMLRYGPLYDFPSLRTTNEEQRTLMDRLDTDREIAQYLAGVLDPDQFTADERARVLTAWTQSRPRRWPRWITPEDIECVRTRDETAADFIVAKAVEAARRAEGPNVSRLIVPGIPVTWSSVEQPDVWQAAATYLTSALSDDAEQWQTATSLLDSWTGSLEDLVRFVRSVHD